MDQLWGNRVAVRMRQALALGLALWLALPANLAAARAVSPLTDWSRVMKLKRGSAVRLMLSEDRTALGLLARADEDGIVFIDTSFGLTKDETRAMLMAYAETATPSMKLRGGALDPTRVAQAVRRAEVREVFHRKRKGSILGAILGAAAGVFLGLVAAFQFVFRECGASCAEEWVMFWLSLVGIPVALGTAGYYARRSDVEETVYRAQDEKPQAERP